MTLGFKPYCLGCVTIEGDKQLSTSSEVRHNSIEMERSSQNNCYEMEEDFNKQIVHSLMALPLLCQVQSSNMKFVEITISQFKVTTSEHSSKCETKCKLGTLLSKFLPSGQSRANKKQPTFHEPAPTLDPGTFFTFFLVSILHAGNF